MEVLFELDDVGVGADSLKNLGLAVHHALILQDLLHCHYFVGCLDAGLQKKESTRNLERIVTLKTRPNAPLPITWMKSKWSRLGSGEDFGFLVFGF